MPPDFAVQAKPTGEPASMRNDHRARFRRTTTNRQKTVTDPPQNILIILGTRPEAIKLAPVVLAAQSREGWKVRVLSTGQHRELLAPILPIFGVEVDHDLALMRDDQSPNDFLAAALTGIDAYLADFPTDRIIVQGDTTSTLAGALAGFHRGIPVMHVEAGLRSGDRDDPFPEEMNRRLVSQLATTHAAATEGNRQNLIDEGIDPDAIVLTGNPVVDALAMIVEREKIEPSTIVADLLARCEGRHPILLTTHRRENIGERRAGIVRAVNRLLAERQDIAFILPIHPNPRVRAELLDGLDEHPHLHIIDPLAYPDFVALMRRSHMILTDSGGLQEEAPSLGVPVLLLRETTERPEAIECGSVAMVGTDTDAIVDAATGLLDDEERYAAMAEVRWPFGGEGAGERVGGSL